MNIEIILQHGWGYDRTFFAGWVEALNSLSWPEDCSLRLILPDRGYFGPAASFSSDVCHCERSANFNYNTVSIVVAHSLGLHFIPAAVLEKATFLVPVCSFLNFHKDAPGGERRSRLVLGRMLTRLVKDPLAVLQDFHKLTAPNQDFKLTRSDISDESLQRLANDLHFLDRVDATTSTTLIGMKSRAIVVHGLEDKLISEQQMLSLAKQLDAETLVCRAGHDLPLSRLDACIGLIERLTHSAVHRRREPCLSR